MESLSMNEEDKEMYVSVFERGYTAIGKEEGRKEVAQNMLRDGLPLEKITQYTNLSREEVEALSVHDNHGSTLN